MNPSRGAGADGDNDGIVDADCENTILIFGCSPGSEVNAVSTVSAEFVQQLQNSVQDDGSIVIPNPQFSKWRPAGGDGEKTELVS